MSEEDRSTWNERYRDGFYQNRPHPCRLLAHWCKQFHGGRALDVACGTGRNSRFLASQGYQVTALDVSDVALTKARSTPHPNSSQINYVLRDLDEGLPALGKFDLIVVVRYLKRELFPILDQHLVAGGHLLVEHHIKYDADDRPLAGPESPEYRLDPEELRTLIKNFDVLYEFEGLITDPDGQYAAISQFVGCKSTTV
ncbi:MAG: methyltransferase domain-containing protein [Gammaproteobacteria bacterium]|nr:methyltransferase domain-containing protein [Gammaproteobacteria bacterium]MYF37749.1 methyltransferase domain-containing protein [Gammaproteobacteria bacterium]